MDSFGIVDQLGYTLDDERVNLSADNYVEIKIKDNLSVVADPHCCNIVVVLNKKSLLFVDLYDYEKICITVPVRRKNKDDHEIIFDLNRNGLDEYFNVDREVDKIFCQHKKIEKCKTIDIIHNIRNAIEDNDYVKDLNFELIVNKMGRALYPIIDKRLKEYKEIEEDSKAMIGNEEKIEVTCSKPVAFVKKLARKIKK